MEENFEPVARTRANYYTPGSPVQFVCVELLKGEVSGEHAVCLTFKNISRVTLTALEIHFKCKGVDGVILCEDEFEYRDLTAKPGESFGMDDAVFVTQKAITSVDVTLRNVYSGRKVVHLESIKRVRLPAPRRLSVEMQKALEARMNRTGMKFMPQVFENGWYCACGAFHPKEEDTVIFHSCLLCILHSRSGKTRLRSWHKQQKKHWIDVWKMAEVIQDGVKRGLSCFLQDCGRRKKHIKIFKNYWQRQL